MPRKQTPPEPPEEQPEQQAISVRDRIVEFKRVPSEELHANALNWRLHPYAQKAALDEVLQQVGIADALIAYYSPRNDGKLTLIDGHERKDRELEWPTLILDVTDEEADLLLLTMDPITGQAQADGEALSALISQQGGVGTPALEDLVRSLALEALDAAPLVEIDGEEPGTGGPPEMELQTFEHYDYVVFLFSNAYDWRAAKERLGLRDEAFTLKDGVSKKVGLGRVLPGSRLLTLLPTEDELEQEIAPARSEPVEAEQ